MAGEVYQFEKAIQKWDALQDRRQFSVESVDGYAAVIHSLHRHHKRHAKHKKEMEVFETEAIQIASGIAMMGGNALVLAGINHPNLYALLSDPECSDIILIGHGNFSDVTGDNGESFGWNYISGNADHLKRGSIVQRFCGHFNEDLSVPFGMFGVSDHRNVIAPVGRIFAPENNIDDESLLRPVSYKPRLSFEDVRLAFGNLRDDIDQNDISGTMD
jgi:hypothetical protein